ncbi:GDSL-type esterase/lipase family protein [Clavibacter michiganensis]|uniref:Esterase n=1 Tax=Clavibacter michiganensis subsp. insidiosus TaxID=33014 RepID=A0A0D5CJI1_9MICO|nr:GDSL-type esterase/lipase family protein [Clavibacter michiganensis]AJW79798.1 esterase [Clavibacter michiganensis subsp. insidiosus]OQJ59309.1 esterase [Clavibacter michiganensis subsp. insidiosus]RII86516.1 esterase [Clavibacter michiganensis subsp. insidiosus]RMC84397.1 esterase [Clavibacter michiganensis subsp. insidiosus]
MPSLPLRRPSPGTVPRAVLRPLVPLAQGAVAAVARPTLRLHLLLYMREMEAGIFPQHDDASAVPGPDPERVLFVGDIGVAGYGVLLAGMAMPAQVAARRTAVTGRGMEWERIASYDMTARKAAAAIADRAAAPLDLAVVALGIPDVLVATSVEEWTDRLTRIVATLRAQAGDGCRIVVTGIPPMDRFQPIPMVARKLLQAQVSRLNRATALLDDPEHGVIHAPYPDISGTRLHVRDRFSYRVMHAHWAEAIMPFMGDPQPVAD